MFNKNHTRLFPKKSQTESRLLFYKPSLEFNRPFKRQIPLACWFSDRKDFENVTFDVCYLDEKALMPADSDLVVKETKSLTNEDFQVIQELPVAIFFFYCVD